MAAWDKAALAAAIKAAFDAAAAADPLAAAATRVQLASDIADAVENYTAGALPGHATGAFASADGKVVVVTDGLTVSIT